MHDQAESDLAIEHAPPPAEYSHARHKALRQRCSAHTLALKGLGREPISFARRALYGWVIWLTRTPLGEIRVNEDHEGIFAILISTSI